MNNRLQQVLDAIDELFADTSVSQEDTLEALKEVGEKLDLLIECIEGDLENT